MAGSDVTLTLFLIIYSSFSLKLVNLELDKVPSSTGTQFPHPDSLQAVFGSVQVMLVW